MAVDLNMAHKKIILVSKHSRSSSNIAPELRVSYENNMRCIDYISKILENLGLSYNLFCRSELTYENIKNNFIISIGGDGTVLEASHYCKDEFLLGVNSDPKNSVGALCVANQDNFQEILLDIFNNKLKPSQIQRLAINNTNILALNDILFCHHNPAAMSRFSLALNSQREVFRASGIWVSTAAGSTGGIFSSGAKAYPIEYDRAFFRVREPFWADQTRPALLEGSFSKNNELIIQSNMNDARIYIDGPHISLDIALGENVRLGISKYPLWLFNAEKLNLQRERIIKPRLEYRKLLQDGE